MIYFRLITLMVALLAIATLINCASYSSFQTADTVEKGKLGGSLGFGKNYLGEEAFGDLKLRAGIGDSTDLGATVNITGYGSTLLMVDLKSQLKTKSKNVKMALGGAISPVFNDDLGLALHLPYYLSVHTPDRILAAYFNPRVLYYFDFDKESEFDNSGFGLGSSIGLKLGDRFSVMPEWGLLYGRHDGSMKVNNFFSIGVGHRIR